MYSDIFYHLLLSFEWRFYHGVNGSKLMWWIRCRGEVKILIEFLDMCKGLRQETYFYSSVLIISRVVLMRQYQFSMP